MKIVSQWFRVREFALMVGIVATTGGLGALSAAAPLALLTGWVGWRFSFQLIGIGTVIMAALVWVFVRNRPQDKGWPSIAEIGQMGEDQSSPPKEIPLWEGAKQVVREKYFWPVALWFFSMMAIFFGFAGLWAGPYLMHVYEMSRAQAGSILNMIAVGMIVGGPLMSLLSDRVLHSRKKVLMLFSAMVVLLMLFLSIFPVGLSQISLYLFMLALSISSSATVVIGFTSAKELFPVEIAGTSVGTVNLFPFLGGAFSQPILGWILDAYPRTASGAYSLEGYQAILLVLLAASAVALACSFFVKETFPLSPRAGAKP
jgi:sugar phosphate permease